MDSGTLLYTARFGWWGSIGGTLQVFHSLTGIHCAKQYAKCLSTLARLREISYCDLTLTATMMGACFKIVHLQYNSFV